MQSTKKSERWDRIGDNPLIIVSRLMEWYEETGEFVGDKDFQKVLELAALIISNDIELDDAKVSRLIVKLSAYSLKFRSQFCSFMSYKKGTDEANMKKNHYRYAYEGIDNLVSSLKYTLK